MEKHLTEGELDRYRDGETTLLERIRIRRHLDACSVCRNLEEELLERRAFLREFKLGILQMDDAERISNRFSAESIQNAMNRKA